MTNLQILDSLFGELDNFKPKSYYQPLELTLIALYCDGDESSRQSILTTYTKMHRFTNDSVCLDCLEAFHAIETHRYHDSAMFISHLEEYQDE